MAYRLYLRLRAIKYTESELDTQLQKRGHSLDKQIQAEDFSFSNYVYEVDILLRRAINKNYSNKELYKWVDKLLFNWRYREKNREEAIKQPESKSNAYEIIAKRRRSIRSWNKTRIKIEEVAECLEIAKWAPSSCNRQLSRVMILQGKEDIMFVSDLFFKQPFANNAPIALLVLVEDLYGSDEKHFAYLDSAAFTQNLLLALDSKGLGSCWLGIKKPDDINQKIDTLRKKFKLSSTFCPISLVLIGAYDTNPTAPPRKSIDQIIINISKTGESKK